MEVGWPVSLCQSMIMLTFVKLPSYVRDEGLARMLSKGMRMLSAGYGGPCRSWSCLCLLSLDLTPQARRDDAMAGDAIANMVTHLRHAVC